MKTKMILAVLVACFVIVISGCETGEYPPAGRVINKPIDCATAVADIRVLEYRKANPLEEVSQSGVADYIGKIDTRIADIEARCGVQ
jgi:hypothetical protein